MSHVVRKSVKANVSLRRAVTRAYLRVQNAQTVAPQNFSVSPFSFLHKREQNYEGYTERNIQYFAFSLRQSASE